MKRRSVEMATQWLQQGGEPNDRKECIEALVQWDYYSPSQAEEVYDDARILHAFGRAVEATVRYSHVR